MVNGITAHPGRQVYWVNDLTKGVCVCYVCVLCVCVMCVLCVCYVCVLCVCYVFVMCVLCVCCGDCIVLLSVCGLAVGVAGFVLCVGDETEVDLVVVV